MKKIKIVKKKEPLPRDLYVIAAILIFVVTVAIDSSFLVIGIIAFFCGKYCYILSRRLGKTEKESYGPFLLGLLLGLIGVIIYFIYYKGQEHGIEFVN